MPNKQALLLKKTYRLWLMITLFLKILSTAPSMTFSIILLGTKVKDNLLSKVQHWYCLILPNKLLQNNPKDSFNLKWNVQTLCNMGSQDFEGNTFVYPKKKINYFSLWKMIKLPLCSQPQSILNSRTENI